MEINQKGKFPNFQISKFPNFQISKFPNFQISGLFLFKSQILTTLFVCLLVLGGCKNELKEIERENSLPSPTQQIVPLNEATNDVMTAKQLNFNYAEINENLDKFALTLALKMKEKEIRELIKEEALKMFDGDYDILYKTFKNLKTKEGATIEEKLVKTNRDIRSQSAKIPLFQISVPVGCEGWNTDSFIPLVAVAPQGIRENEVLAVKAYDANGKVHYLSAKETPKEPIIVVGMSERTDLEGNVFKGYGPPKKISSNGRLQNSPEYLGRLYSTNPTEIESWWLGDWDMRLNVIISSNGGQSASRIIDNMNFSASQRCVSETHGGGQNGCFFGDFLFTWLPLYGEIVNYNWIEDDGGGWINELQVQATFNFLGQNITVNTSIPQKPFDRNLGLQPVWKGEPAWRYYGSSSVFSFQIYFTM